MQKIVPEGNLYVHKMLEMEVRLASFEQFLGQTEQNQARIMEENRLLRREILKVHYFFLTLNLNESASLTPAFPLASFVKKSSSNVDCKAHR